MSLTTYRYPRAAINCACVSSVRRGVAKKLILIERGLEPFKGRGIPGGFREGG